MTTKFILIACAFVTLKIYGAVNSCDIYIHGIGNEAIYDNKARVVKWNSHQEIEDGAFELAEKTLEQINFCEDGWPVMLHAHNYGAETLFYILGQGKRFEKFFPDHVFVRLYKKTIAVYSYAGSFSGTPLMDLICSNGTYPEISEILGEKCVLSMSTSSLHHPSNVVFDPGVPFYLIYSTKSDSLFGEALSNYRFSEKLDGRVNLNDGIVMLSSSKACRNVLDMYDNNNCEKIHQLFIDYRSVKDKGHYQLAKGDRDGF